MAVSGGMIPRRRRTNPRASAAAKFERYSSENIAVAKIILRCPDVYGGEEAGLVRWAHALFERVDREEAAARSNDPQPGLLGGAQR